MQSKFKIGDKVVIVLPDRNEFEFLKTGILKHGVGRAIINCVDRDCCVVTIPGVPWDVRVSEKYLQLVEEATDLTPEAWFDIKLNKASL